MEEVESIGATLLFDSVNRGKVKMIRFILDSVDSKLLNSRDIKGRTPLMMCCFIKEEVTRGQSFLLLLQHGADTNVTDDIGRDTLSYACEQRCNDLVRILARCNINPEVPDIKGNTPLIYCAMVGNDVATDLLVRHFSRLGLHADHMNKEGFTALLMAAKMGNIHCAEILVLQGKASLLHRDRVHGWSADEWFESLGLSLKDTLKAACRAAKKQKFRRVISVVQAIKPTNKQIIERTDTEPRVSNQPRLTSELLHRRESLQTHSNASWDDDDDLDSAAVRGLKAPEPQRGPRGYRSASLCVPMLSLPEAGRSSRRLVQRQFSLQDSSGMESWARSQCFLPVPTFSRSHLNEIPRGTPARRVETVSDSDTSESATEIQSLSATSMEKLEQEISSLF